MIPLSPKFFFPAKPSTWSFGCSVTEDEPSISVLWWWWWFEEEVQKPSEHEPPGASWSTTFPCDDEPLGDGILSFRSDPFILAIQILSKQEMDVGEERGVGQCGRLRAVYMQDVCAQLMGLSDCLRVWVTGLSVCKFGIDSTSPQYPCRHAAFPAPLFLVQCSVGCAPTQSQDIALNIFKMEQIPVTVLEMSAEHTCILCSVNQFQR